MGIVTQIRDLDNSSKKATAFSNSKGGGFKALDASDQSIADLVKKKAVYNLTNEISSPHENRAVASIIKPGMRVVNCL